MFGEFHHLFKELWQDPARIFLVFMYVHCNIQLHFIKSKTPITEEIRRFQETYFPRRKALCHTAVSKNKVTI
jgi:hypothetical protein